MAKPSKKQITESVQLHALKKTYIMKRIGLIHVIPNCLLTISKSSLTRLIVSCQSIISVCFQLYWYLDGRYFFFAKLEKKIH